MNYKTKINRLNNESRAMLALRMIDTVKNSGIDEAKSSKAYVNLETQNTLYQTALESGTDDEIMKAIKNKYKERKTLFIEMYEYLDGTKKSPDAAMKAAAELIFKQVGKYGKNFDNNRLADQSLRYLHIIDALKTSDYEAALSKTLLNEKLSLLENSHYEYEALYMQRGNDDATKTSASNLSNDLNAAIKKYMDEVNWMTTRTDTDAWYSLRNNLLKRFDEVNVTNTRKPTSNTDEPTSNNLE